MAIESKVGSMRWIMLRMAVMVLLASWSLGGRALAQDAGAHDRIYVVTHVDIVPPNTASGHKTRAAICFRQPQRQRHRAN